MKIFKQIKPSLWRKPQSPHEKQEQSFLRRQESPTIVPIILLLCLTLFTACEKPQWTLDRIAVNCTNYPENCVNGTCINDVCVCNTGWYGENCNSQNPEDSIVIVNPCDGIDCGENGVCINGVCECEEGWAGDNCETEIITFEEVFDSPFGSWGINVEIIADAYVFTGGKLNNGKSDITLTKTNFEGIEIWSQSYGDFDQTDDANDFVVTDDGSYVIVGRSWTSISTSDLLLIKTDEEGNELWLKKYDIGDNGVKVELTNDEGYLIFAKSNNQNSSNDITYLLKTDSDGNEEWSKTLDEASIVDVLKVNNGFTLMGRTVDNDYHLWHINDIGDIEWVQSFVLNSFC